MWLCLILLLAAPAGAQQKPHSALGCASCHSESTGQAVSGTCQHCHAKEAKIFSASQHGLATEGGPNCVTCHGAHEFKTAQQIERQCLECHRTPPLFFMNRVQRVAGKVSCMNCHSAHSD